MENTCAGACESHDHKPQELSRKALLSGMAAVLSGIGLTTFAAEAEAAAKSYKVAKTSAIPVKSAKVFTVNGVSILITQPRTGVFRAFRNRCTHEPKRIGAQKISSGTVTCFEHGQQFNADTGAATGFANQTNVPLTKYTAKVKSGYIYVTV